MEYKAPNSYDHIYLYVHNCVFFFLHFKESGWGFDIISPESVDEGDKDGSLLCIKNIMVQNVRTVCVE